MTLIDNWAASFVTGWLTKRNLAAQPKASGGKRVLPWELKAVYQMRNDIKTMNDARNMALSNEPKNYSLQLLLDNIGDDALLTSQIENRKQQVFSIDFVFKKPDGSIDEEQTALLKTMPAYRQITEAVLDSRYRGYRLIEQSLEKTESGVMKLLIDVKPNANVVPQTGRFYKDYLDDSKFIEYRLMSEYGTWILEFFNSNLGLLNKAIPHVLFKRFAQSCWSELCEIYGIPPRVLKTNTQDKTMLNRATAMMQDMGAAAWFIIDETESFEFAQGVATNGDVYKNFINLCSNEISMLISGAIIGQDTVNGNRSKDESAQDVLWLLVQSDMAMLEEMWNTVIIPSWVKLGILKGDVSGEFMPAADIEQLWKFTSGSLQYFNVDPEWMKNTFGVEVTGERQTAAAEPGNEKGKDTSKQSFKLSDFFE